MSMDYLELNAYLNKHKSVGQSKVDVIAMSMHFYLLKRGCKLINKAEVNRY
jgi:hypothetical protein